MHQFKEVPKFIDLANSPKGLKAVLWDMDGTIMETEYLHALSTQTIINNHHSDLNLSYLEVEAVCIGESDKTIFDTFKSRDLLVNYSLENFIVEKNSIISKELISLSPSSIFNPKIENLMKEFGSKGIKQAVVTSSEKEITHTLLKYLNLFEIFELILTREDTSENKPSPVPYLRAMELLGVNSNEVIIFEDSPTGLSAAKESNALTFQACWY
ncbi:MAG: beta-phosphoglucomutase-like phosphatase (HAD superfamily) [Bacteriovoracaceae bacterium]|jgi:beta-phosphoglucomutase